MLYLNTPLHSALFSGATETGSEGLWLRDEEGRFVVSNPDICMVFVTLIGAEVIAQESAAGGKAPSNRVEASTEGVRDLDRRWSKVLLLYKLECVENGWGSSEEVSESGWGGLDGGIRGGVDGRWKDHVTPLGWAR